VSGLPEACAEYTGCILFPRRLPEYACNSDCHPAKRGRCVRHQDTQLVSTLICSLESELTVSLLIDGIGAQAIGYVDVLNPGRRGLTSSIGLFWLIQKRWVIRTKTMLLVVSISP
jgi:hypothetical protein